MTSAHTVVVYVSLLLWQFIEKMWKSLHAEMIFNEDSGAKNEFSWSANARMCQAVHWLRRIESILLEISMKLLIIQVTELLLVPDGNMQRMTHMPYSIFWYFIVILFTVTGITRIYDATTNMWITW